MLCSNRNYKARNFVVYISSNARNNSDRIIYGKELFQFLCFYGKLLSIIMKRNTEFLKNSISFLKNKNINIFCTIYFGF